ncbi:hypothetical protein QQF64_017232 [Cirrhinus molitorella]|uniref:Uncharacterized protein n=1 Tax=Cirrhinus molitorella TaxID=172907 RepID=A0ABR3LLG1_9TELE
MCPRWPPEDAPVFFCEHVKTLEEQLKEGTILCVHNQPTAGEIKTPVQCVENNKGSGGVIIHDWETFTMSKQHLVAACDHTDDSYYNSTSKQSLSFEGKNSVSVQYVDTQEGISQDTFEDDNILIGPTVKAHFSSMHGEPKRSSLAVVYDEVSYPIRLQPQAEPDVDDEGIVPNMKEDEGQELY